MPSSAEESSEPTVSASDETHYDVLRISPDATPDEIKAAYRSLIVLCHPDKLNGKKCDRDASEATHISEKMSALDLDDEDEHDNELENNSENESDESKATNDSSRTMLPSTDEKETSAESTKFHRIQAAYRCLRDPDKRRQYDEGIRREKEREGRRLRGALQVYLSEMESEWCCVVDEESSDDEDGVGQPTGDDARCEETQPMQKVFFHPCRCGDVFQVVQDELLESLGATNLFSNRVWPCESCGLKIQIHVDIEIDE